jgi:hypothetical protein
MTPQAMAFNKFKIGNSPDSFIRPCQHVGHSMKHQGAQGAISGETWCTSFLVALTALTNLMVISRPVFVYIRLGGGTGTTSEVDRASCCLLQQ